jgi:hypothetical protein
MEEDINKMCLAKRYAKKILKIKDTSRNNNQMNSFQEILEDIRNNVEWIK